MANSESGWNNNNSQVCIIPEITLLDQQKNPRPWTYSFLIYLVLL